MGAGVEKNDLGAGGHVFRQVFGGGGVCVWVCGGEGSAVFHWYSFSLKVIASGGFAPRPLNIPAL